MAVIMTFDEYIRNPLGKENGLFTHRNMYMEMYTEKFHNIMAREAGELFYQLYKSGNKYIIYAKIPSEVVTQFYYDVVVEFSPPTDNEDSLLSIKNYTVKFYSNDPWFNFTYAYSFNQNKLLINFLKPKLSKSCLTTAAKVKNPTNSVGYVKSLFFLYIFMKDRGLFKKILWLNAKALNDQIFLQNIMPADEKIALRQEKGKEVNKIKAEQKADKTSKKSKFRASGNKRSGKTAKSRLSRFTPKTKKTGFTTKSKKF